MDTSKILVLVLDRDPASREQLARIMTEQGYAVETSDTEKEACALAEQRRFNLVIKGFEAARIDAVALMKEIRALTPDTQFILVGKGGSIQTAVSALHQGAFDYLDKPCDPVLLLEAVRKALDHQALVAEDPELKSRLRRRADPDIFVGDSPAAQRIRALVGEVAPADITVLLTGESGTGKEIVARAIHARSRRRTGAFIAVNSAALPDALIESELFGHVRGAFTGAVSDRLGRFQMADRGTLFLDEVADLSAKGQADLLRVLEDGMFRPVGSPKLLRADVRIIAATNRELEQAVAEGRFRDDLFYRLNIVEIRLPPLRERAEDIPALAEAFLAHFCAKHQRRRKTLARDVLDYFLSLRWPGNIRQLRNICERLVVTAPGATIQLADLPETLMRTSQRDSEITLRAGLTLAQVEAELIRQTLRKVTRNRAEAARVLGISKRALQYKLKRYRLGEA
jgi:DNA-binding NtrC family response regulator